MVYIRGQRQDYDDWRELGNEGWGYRDVLPYFKKAENQHRGADEFHGIGGPIDVHDQFERNELCDAFFAAAREVGFRLTKTLMGAIVKARLITSSLPTDGAVPVLRLDTFRPARRRVNLTILVNAQATRLLLQDRQVVGVEFIKDGQRFRVNARREVILSAGAFNSPHLLQLSGIGPAERLRASGISVLHDLSVWAKASKTILCQLSSTNARSRSH